MKIAGRFSFKGGAEAVASQYRKLLGEIEACIASIEASDYLTKKSREKTMPDRMLYSPTALNKQFKKFLCDKGWKPHRVKCEYTDKYYDSAYQPAPLRKSAFRAMDFVKRRLGVEVQFGKYAFMVYNVCAKMTIFHKLDIIDVGIEIVPMKDFAARMSTGVSYFEQFVWDLEHRGVSDIDIPVLILGIDR